MAKKRQESVAGHYDAAAGDYHRQYQRTNLKSLKDYPANYFRLQILTRRLASADCKRVYEIGVGEGTPLVTMAKMGFAVAGCDISEGMVEVARRNFRRNRLDPRLIQWGDIEDTTTIANQIAPDRFDAVVAAGVLPHVRNDALMLENVKMMLKPGGKALIEFRNKLFSLFTLNRYTKEFILDDLLGGVEEKVRTAVGRELDRRLATDLPPERKGPGGKGPSYDRILAKFHNPFELTELFEAAGFGNIQIHWYHYHPAPPMLEAQLGTDFREAAMALEHEGGWRGMFLCSAGVVEADLL